MSIETHNETDDQVKALAYALSEKLLAAPRSLKCEADEMTKELTMSKPEDLRAVVIPKADQLLAKVTEEQVKEIQQAVGGFAVAAAEIGSLGALSPALVAALMPRQQGEGMQFPPLI